MRSILRGTPAICAVSRGRLSLLFCADQRLGLLAGAFALVAVDLLALGAGDLLAAGLRVVLRTAALRGAAAAPMACTADAAASCVVAACCMAC